jgi:YD repeat-containing protein
MSKVEFAYDESGSILDNDGPIQHQSSYNSTYLAGRGNLSSVKRHDVLTGQFNISRLKYNTAGSYRATVDPVGHQTSLSYADSFSDNNNTRNTLAYPTSLIDADGFTSTSQYNYDFGRITRSQTPPPAGHAVGPIKKYTYDSKSRIEKVAIEITGNTDYTHTRFEYPTSQNRIDTYTTIEAGQGEALAFKLFDGQGRTIADVSAHPGSSGLFSAKLMLFDQLGRAIKESNPTETNVSGSYLQWQPTGDDSPTNGGLGWLYTAQTYDWNSRPLITTNPDNTTKTASYDGCSCAGGDSVTVTDEGTLADGTTKRRQEKSYRDVLGRVIRTETYNWDGAGPNGTNGTIYSTTVNNYNARDQVTRSRKFEGAAPADPDAASCLSESLRFGTDNTWKQSQTNPSGWWNLGFDDSSWSESVDEGGATTSPWGMGGFSSDTPAHWIWYHDTRFGQGDTTLLYFRKTFVATSTSATLTLRADNIYVAYLNGVQISTGNQWQVTNTVNLSLTPGASYVLAVEVLNQGGPGGLIAEVKSIGTSCEQGVMTYDGYGRLKTRHVPGQDLNGITTYNYDDDDTLTSLVDARGATTTFSHANNNRHLVTGITYDVPAGSGITDPSDVTYGYDGVGNRTSMSDGLGSMSYQYDQLSRLSSETRNFADQVAPFLNASYALNYQYNLANQPKKITDPTNSTINYNYDQVGRVTGVTGENNLYAGVSTYASSATYRAWNALEGVTYGNNYTTAIKYNARLQGSDFEVSGRPAQFGAPTVMKTTYDYYADGALKFAHDTIDERFDRAYSYQNEGRLKEAYSGSEARDYVNGTNSGTATGPYRQSYMYDVYGHLTQRSNRFWSQFDSFNASYANNRRQDPAYHYDADGRLTQDADLHYSYDAAGRNVTTFDNLTFSGQMTTVSYNGDGLSLKKNVAQSGQTTVTYYVRSSVLGGRVVTELNGQGQKQTGFVFVGSQLLARQENNAVVWQHINPLTGSSGDSFANGNYVITNEPDPMGVNMGTEDPFANLPMPGFEPSPLMPMMLGLGDPSGCGSNPNCTRCYLDGFEIGCGQAFEMLDRGTAQFDTFATVRVTYTSGRTETFTGRTTLPPGMDVRFTGGLAEAAWLGFRLGNIWGGFDTGVHWALNNAMLAQQAAGNERIGSSSILGSFISYFAPPQGGTGTAITPNKDKDIAKAVALARSILSTKNPCSDFFGPNATKALNALEAILTRGLPNGPGDTKLGIEMSGSQVMHYNPIEFRTFQKAVINNAGPFFNILSKTRFGNYGPGQNQSKVLQLLHELAHLVYDKGAPLIPDDSGPTKTKESDENTEEVLKHCKAEIDKIKN